MKAIILAGGFGTRLRPTSCTRPKILFPIINKPLLQWTLEKLAKSGVKEAIMAVSHRTEPFIKQFEVSKYGIKLTYSRDPLKNPLGTGGPIKKAENLISHDENFFVLNEDIFADIDYTKISEAHEQNEEKDAIATIALHEVRKPERYGVAELTRENRIKRFIEKPLPGTAPTNLINAGIYVLTPRIFDYIPKGQTVSIEREVFPKLVKEKKLYGYVFDGLWIDIGKLEDYLKINKILLDSFANQCEREVVGVEVKKPVAFDEGVSIGEKSVIGPYAVLGRNVTVGENVRIQNSVIFPGTVISDFSSVDGAIIGENVAVGKCVKIGEGCVLGDHVKVRDNVVLVKGVSICPGKEVSESVLTPKNII